MATANASKLINSKINNNNETNVDNQHIGANESFRSPPSPVERFSKENEQDATAAQVTVTDSENKKPFRMDPDNTKATPSLLFLPRPPNTANLDKRGLCRSRQISSSHQNTQSAENATFSNSNALESVNQKNHKHTITALQKSDKSYPKYRECNSPQTTDNENELLFQPRLHVHPLFNHPKASEETPGSTVNFSSSTNYATHSLETDYKQQLQLHQRERQLTPKQVLKDCGRDDTPSLRNTDAQCNDEVPSFSKCHQR